MTQEEYIKDYVDIYIHHLQKTPSYTLIRFLEQMKVYHDWLKKEGIYKAETIPFTEIKK